MTEKRRQSLIIELAGCKSVLANPTDILLALGGKGTLAAKRAKVELKMRLRMQEIENELSVYELTK